MRVGYGARRGPSRVYGADVDSPSDRAAALSCRSRRSDFLIRRALRLEGEESSANAETYDLAPHRGEEGIARFAQDRVENLLGGESRSQGVDAGQPLVNVAWVGREERARVVGKPEVSERQRLRVELEKPDERGARGRRVEARGNRERQIHGRAVVADGVAREEDPVRRLEEADVMRSVPRRFDGDEGDVGAEREGFTARAGDDAVAVDREGFPVERGERRACGPHASDEARWIQEVGKPARVHDEEGLRVRKGQVSRGARVVEMDVCDEDVVESKPAQSLKKTRGAGGRSRVDESGLRRAQEVGAARVRLSELGHVNHAEGGIPQARH